jgi:hypothetical protein
MAKIDIIDMCRGCSHRYNYTCMKELRPCPLIGIPDWCPLEDANGWISVEDRLPEKIGNYLVWCNSIASQKHPSICSKVDVLFFVTGCDWKDAKVLFWMPLPTPPDTSKRTVDQTYNTVDEDEEL